MLRLQGRDGSLVLPLRPERPADDVVTAGEEVPERALDVAVPQHLPAQAAAHGPPDQPGQGDATRQVQPDQGVRGGSQLRAGRPVLPLGDPLRTGRQLCDLGQERLPIGPVRPVVERVDLGVRDAGEALEPARERRLPDPRDAGEQDAAGATGERVRRAEHPATLVTCEGPALRPRVERTPATPRLVTS
ncbi:hypothetical protein GCM10025866_25660 [Naasia aerilata]|uniref:Uncharacterized protein n=1 Tax=Naasia aerilata TaxID=1162966 RepID=A0ABN6XNT6_9MICO|nr:hypothetical protein GCM10025866_25660 [Naasia aerilata]